MDRSKRAIKTPKRFDDEAFGPSPKQQLPTKPSSNETAKPSPSSSSFTFEPTTPKNIIKVKLTKARPRELLVRPTKQEQTPAKSIEPTTAKDILTPKETPKPREPTKSKESVTKSKEPSKPKEPVKPKELAKSKELTKTKEPTKPRESIKLKDPTKLKELAKPPKESFKTEELTKPKELVKQPKEPAKPKEVTKSKEIVVKQPREVARSYKEKPKELAKLRDFPKVEIRTPERDSQLVYRPKSKRPRTPPIFVDLIPNVILPFWDARTAAEDHEDDNVKELVHCHCGIAEELGLMVQCETCLTWQHAHCLGIERPEDAPDGYTCRACSDPKFARDSMKWAYDQDWLTKGRMKQFPCDPNPIPEKRVNTLRQINTLISHALQIHQLIHSLGIKNRLLMNASDDDPELKLFRHQWPASYQHRDGTHFMPTINHPSSTPASTISAIGDNETPDPGDITVDTVTDVTLPDIGHLDDVTAILENSYVESTAPTMQPMVATNDITPDDCRANLRLHIQQTEEFISIELAQIEEQLTKLERVCSKGSNLETSLESLKNDLLTMKKYTALKKHCES